MRLGFGMLVVGFLEAFEWKWEACPFEPDVVAVILLWLCENKDMERI